VRIALGSAIVQQIFGGGSELQVVVLDPALEKLLAQALGGGDALGLEPGLADTLLRETAAAARHLESLGRPQVLLVADRLRLPLARMLRRALPQMKVLAHAEVPETRTLRVSAIVGGKT
jgi:flagellar biosynthesis protein FlhA